MKITVHDVLTPTILAAGKIIVHSDATYLQPYAFLNHLMHLE